MKFSILVPVYNVEQYLEQCVESLLSQTYIGEYEIILVDDGSTDSSGKICDNYAADYPEKVKVVHKKNEGLVSAREHGIKNASGDFCLFVDSDDFVENNLLESVSNSLKRHNDADLIIYSFSYLKNGVQTERTATVSDSEKVFDGSNKKELYQMLIAGNLVTALWIKAVKTDILRSDPIDYTLYYNKNMAEDMFRSVHILTAANKTVYINEKLYNYRICDESISRSFRPETICKKNILYVYNRIREYLPQWDMDDAETIERLNGRWLDETMYTFLNYYRNAESKLEKQQILEYDWSSMMPQQAIFEKSKYESKLYRKWFDSIVKHRYFSVKWFFFKEKVWKFLRHIKSKVLN